MDVDPPPFAVSPVHLINHSPALCVTSHTPPRLALSNDPVVDPVVDPEQAKRVEGSVVEGSPVEGDDTDNTDVVMVTTTTMVSRFSPLAES